MVPSTFYVWWQRNHDQPNLLILRQFNKVEGYRVSIQKSVFPYSKNKLFFDYLFFFSFYYKKEKPQFSWIPSSFRSVYSELALVTDGEEQIIQASTSHRHNCIMSSPCCVWWLTCRCPSSGQQISEPCVHLHRPHCLSSDTYLTRDSSQTNQDVDYSWSQIWVWRSWDMGGLWLPVVSFYHKWENCGFST